MRRNPAELILAILLSSLPAAAATHIDAPMPPYCNPRGNWAECELDPPSASVIEFSTADIAEIAECRPFVRERTDRAFLVAGGYAKLTLRWAEDESEPDAILAVISHRVLVDQIADQLAARYQMIFDQEGVLAVAIERFEWPWQRSPESDWCNLDRENPKDAWIVECGTE